MSKSKISIYEFTPTIGSGSFAVEIAQEVVSCRSHWTLDASTHESFSFRMKTPVTDFALAMQDLFTTGEGHVSDGLNHLALATGEGNRITAQMKKGKGASSIQLIVELLGPIAQLQSLRFRAGE